MGKFQCGAMRQRAHRHGVGGGGGAAEDARPPAAPLLAGAVAAAPQAGGEAAQGLGGRRRAPAVPVGTGRTCETGGKGVRSAVELLGRTVRGTPATSEAAPRKKKRDCGVGFLPPGAAADVAGVPRTVRPSGSTALPRHIFRREIPELSAGARPMGRTVRAAKMEQVFRANSSPEQSPSEIPQFQPRPPPQSHIGGALLTL